jgi:hypothetical protein
MLNGKKFGEGKPKLMFGSAPTKTTPKPAVVVLDLEIAEAKYVTEQIQVENPIFALFAFYRYYLMLGGKEENCKYKAIVKVNLNHPRYQDKRDEILKLVDNKDYYLYW